MLKKRFIKTMTFIVGSMLAFAIVACGDSGSKSPGGLSNLGTETYAGTANGVLYTLTITEKAGKAAYAPQGGDSYELTAAAKTSTGTVESFVSGTFTLVPSGDSGNTFFVTVSGIGITVMSGTITWDGGAIESAPANFIPKTTGAADDPFLISTSADLLKVGKGTDGWTLDAHYKLINDINMTGVTWTPIGDFDYEQMEYIPIQNLAGFDYTYTFTGSFDGNGKKIYNLKISSASDFTALFGCVGPGGTVKSLELEDAIIAGGNFGAIESCHVSGEITGDISANDIEGPGGIASGNFGTIKNCYVTANIKGSVQTGGIVGENYGMIENCYFTGEVTGTGEDKIGGITGGNKGTIKNCYVTGKVTAINSEQIGGITGNNRGMIENCYATGDVTGKNYVGGVAGYNGEDSNRVVAIKNCVALNKNVSATATDAGRVVGKNDTGLELSNNYARNDMSITGPGYTADVGADKKDGTSVLTSTLDSAEWATLPWDFTGVWNNMDGTKLPTLRGVGGVQNPTVVP